MGEWLEHWMRTWDKVPPLAHCVASGKLLLHLSLFPGCNMGILISVLAIPRVTVTRWGVVQVPGAVLAGVYHQPPTPSSCSIFVILLVPASSPEPGTQDSSAKMAAILPNEERETP